MSSNSWGRAEEGGVGGVFPNGFFLMTFFIILLTIVGHWSQRDSRIDRSSKNNQLRENKNNQMVWTRDVKVIRRITKSCGRIKTLREDTKTTLKEATNRWNKTRHREIRGTKL